MDIDVPSIFKRRYGHFDASWLAILKKGNVCCSLQSNKFYTYAIQVYFWSWLGHNSNTWTHLTLTLLCYCQQQFLLLKV